MAGTCPTCSTALPDGARFCPGCGRPVAADGPAERKLATVLFADVAGSTALAARLDAEELRAVLGDVYRELSAAAAAYGGTVEKFIGDAVMAVFGVPAAHEDDPERAIRAALAMRSRMAVLSARRDLPLVLRIGVNTGAVVSGIAPGSDFLVTGEAVNLAARLQAAAEPGEVLVGERTFRAVEPLVRTVQPRSLRVKGRAGPVAAYAVEGIAPVAAYRGRTRPGGPFVGRDEELALLRSLCERAISHSRPHLITVIGEPGIGKTRLAQELVVELQRWDEPPATWVGRCLPYGHGGPYAPLREVLVRAAAARGDEPPAELARRIGGHLIAAMGEDAGAAIAEVLRTAGLPTAEIVADVDPDEDPDTADAWRDALVALARQRPAVIGLEDAHWAEPALLDVIEDVAAADGVPLVALCLARDQLLEERPAWGSGVPNATTVTLDALTPDDARRLALALADGREPPPGAVLRAGGNPFFLEEILAMRGEGGGRRIPETVQGVIAARLDLLPLAEKQLLQAASVIGREFRLDALAAVTDEPRVLAMARRLVDRDLLVAGPAAHAFKHSLIRDVAYESLPRADRARQHLRLARWLAREPDSSRQVIASHYATAVELGAAECRGDAVRYLLEASKEAIGVYAHGLALRQGEGALLLAETDDERARAYEAIGDAHWIAEHGDASFEGYAAALEHGERADLPAADRARLAWKWVDLPTRWGALLVNPPAKEAVEHVLESGLADARAAGSRVTEMRFLVARALHAWRHETDPAALARGLDDADRALALAREADLAAVMSAAMDARAVLLVALARYCEAVRVADARFVLVPRIRRREEQLDACALAVWTRTMVGRYADAVAAADAAEELAADGQEHWLRLVTAAKVEALFFWDRWEPALAAYERFLAVHRATGRRAAGSRPERAAGVAAAIALLRGDLDAAERLEQRAGGGTVPAFQLLVAHALVGRGEPELALDRVERIRPAAVHEPVLHAVTAEAQALAGRWDDLDATLARTDECRGMRDLPRPRAQLDRARGIAGDEVALQRATDLFKELGCSFEHARCLELRGREAQARKTYRRLGAAPALARVGG